MSNYPDTTAIYEATGKWEEAFRDLLDEIYWKGYSEMLVAENPVAYQREYSYFMAMYDDTSSVLDAEINPQGSGVSYE